MSNPRKKRLQSGYTTGAAAAAAVKGAVTLLATGKAPARVRIPFLSEGTADIEIRTCFLERGGDTAVCAVIKEAGDDPDVTNKAVIGARVTLSRNKTSGDIRIEGGQGVGRVTKPGLEVSPGCPAINPGPLKMINSSVEAVFPDGETRPAITIEIFVPEGERLAEKTLNKRLGIVGGISILGTTGIVRPMSHEAYIATITAALSVARAAGLSTVVFTTGRRSERFSQAIFKAFPEEAFIQIGDFFEKSLRSAAEGHMRKIVLAVFFGKAVKMARGIPHTHASKAQLTLDELAGWALDAADDRTFAKEITRANTARHAFDIIRDTYPEVIGEVGRRMVVAAEKFTDGRLNVRGIIFNYDGTIVFDSGEG